MGNAEMADSGGEIAFHDLFRGSQGQPLTTIPDQEQERGESVMVKRKRKDKAPAGRFRTLRKVLAGYLILVGIGAHVAAAAGLVIALRYFHLTPRQFLVKAVEKAGLRTPMVEELLTPPAAFSNHVFDGRVKRRHPRILLPELADWDGRGKAPLMTERMALWKAEGTRVFDPCNGGGALGAAACWLNTGRADAAAKALGALRGFRLNTPDSSGHYGNGWELAWLYDLMSLHPDLSEADRLLVQQKLELGLRDYLALLDDEGPSLWHGRATLAAQAWLCAVALDDPSPERQELIDRAQGHFLDVLRAMEMSEAWPEGYNYWINVRALQLLLGMAAYLNGLEGAQQAPAVKRIVNRLGLWHVYATRPDNRIEDFGDSGPRVDLKDESRRVVDLIAQLTGNPVFSSFSRYLYALHGEQSYYRGYRWSFTLLNDPSVPSLPGIEPGSLANLERWLPRADLFGRGFLNQGYIRSGWGKDDTFISFRAGNVLTHHGHYDAGHFSLYKGAPLAINSGTYGAYMEPNRLNYSIRTVAKNSLLVLRPGEKVQPNRFFKDNVADGGQRVIIPTGSWVRSVEDYLQNIGDGLHFEGGGIRAFEHQDGLYTYVSADLTRAYNSTRYDDNGRGGKGSLVSRELLYLFGEDRLIVHDRVDTTDPSYTKKWLLHTKVRPEVEGLRVLKGKEINGILESTADTAMVSMGRSHLRVDRIYPRDAVMRLVGGPDYRFYVEKDGDDSDLDGENMIQGANIRPWFDTGMWRIEVQPGAPRKSDHFLMVLSPSLDSPVDTPARVLDIRQAGVRGLSTGQSLVVFVERGIHDPLSLPLIGGETRLLLFGITPLANVELSMDGFAGGGRASADGVASLELPSGLTGMLKVRW
jgi:hypothetical protein